MQAEAKRTKQSIAKVFMFFSVEMNDALVTKLQPFYILLRGRI